jgi:hypothetical protein
VCRALSLVAADAHIMRNVCESAPLRAQRPHNPCASPPRAPHRITLRLAASAFDAHLAGEAVAMANAQDATDAARSLGADLACIAWRTPERAHVLDGAFAPRLFSARSVEKLSARRLDVAARLSACRPPSHSGRALAGILLVFVVCPSCRSASLPARCIVLPLGNGARARVPALR